jgi:23S rRNA pseudouridine1911/1915/1917 synthase
VNKPEILWEDAHILVVNKRPGMPVQEDKSQDPSLLSLMADHYSFPLYLINRLDRPASGIVLIAKNKESAANLSHLIQDKKIQKNYLAAVSQAPPQPEESWNISS